MTVVAVADSNQERLAHLRTVHPHVQAMTDYQELLGAGLDAIVIATPPVTHYRFAKEALQQGLHVFVEKPLALDTAHARELVQLAEEHDRALMVGHIFVFNPAVRALRSMIESEEIGRVYYIDMVRVSLGLFQHDLNVLWDLAPHDVSILLYLLGCDPIAVSAYGASCVQYGVEDVAYMRLVLPNYSMAHIRLSWLDPCKVRRVTVVGSKKMVVYDDIEIFEKLRVYDKGVTCVPYPDSFGEFQFSYHYGDITIPQIKLAEPMALECAHFVECIEEHKRPETDGYNGLKVVQIIEHAQRSLRNGGTLEQLFYEPDHSVAPVVA